jgi:predicted negative regulator of RcsB-dependent stress response
MKIWLQGFVPYWQSIHWRIHDAYFAKQGVGAFGRGLVPSLSTNNYALARQHAQLAAAHVAALEEAGHLQPTDPIDVLEVGAGRGTFAALFLRALDEGTGERGRTLGRRVRYHYSDYSERMVRQAATGPELAESVAAGRVVPCIYDARQPSTLRSLDGTETRIRAVFVFANYLCCVLPTQPLQKRGGDGSRADQENDDDGTGWRELHARVSADVQPDAKGQVPSADVLLERYLSKADEPDLMARLETEYAWRSPGENALPVRQPHAQTLANLVAGMDDATVRYPFGFLDMLEGMEALTRAGAITVVTDFGDPDGDALRGRHKAEPKWYGNTVNHRVNFAVFDAFAATRGWRVLRTQVALRSLQTAVLGPPPFDPGHLTQAFAELYVNRYEAQELLDLSAAAKALLKEDDADTAVRLLARAVELDPYSARLRYRLGSACIDAELPPLALEHLLQGQAADAFHADDFDFQLGRVYTRLGRLDDAAASYERSIAHDNHATAWVNLGNVHAARGTREAARSAYERALALDPGSKRAREALAKLGAR